MINDAIVGMENLPNVFIEKISLHSQQSGGIRISVTITMHDNKKNPSWFNKIDDIKIKIVFEDDATKISNLNNGIVSLNDYIVTNRSPNKVISTSELVARRNIGDYESYSKVIEITLSRPPENLNVYAACFIDNLGFNNPLFDKFYGPMAAERILIGGEINSLSNYFYYADTNEEYGGPVHQKPDGTYMEGSEHSDRPHKEVTLVVEENYKIQSFNFDSGLYVDVGFAPPDPSPLVNMEGATVAVENNVETLNPVQASLNIEEPDFNLVGNTTPVNPPTGY